MWMKEFLRYSIGEVAAALHMSEKTILHYILKCLNSVEVKAETLGRLINSFLMQPHVDFVIMEAVLDHPEKTPLRNCSECLRTDRVRTCSFKHNAVLETEPF